MSAALPSANETRHALTVADDESGMRLDKYLTDALARKFEAEKSTDGPPSRARVKQLIEEGRAEIEGTRPRPLTDASYRVKSGEQLTLTLPPPAPARPEGQAIPLDVVYEDADLIVVMKPAGLVVHPAPGNPDMTLVNALIAHCGETLSGIGGERRPGIVHRLDKETSGLMVVAKTDRAHRGLAEQFAAHGRDGKLTRAYKALVWGVPSPKRGTVDANIARSSHNRMKMAALKPRTRRDEEEDDGNAAGRRAITHYEVEREFADGIVSLVECRLETGRTHQIRVHMTHIGHPVLGDPTYGTGMKTRASKLSDEARAALARLNRQALHAWHLGFEHPVTGEHLSFDTPLPEDMAELVGELEGENTDF
ncbi:MAG: RluA family pseudouridine synthase [Alphaproteobacteria bacterium]|nr:RluA family pseudouridine synthase [Alphaproteobacteria bacterium]MDX5416932.1 RluA family pseudouridine synthase [Alphaproteobacteria bacterium]MDX5494330.1 RluA family pseudouridine synthase [Alphaproteobacteria bacterium]